MVYLSLDYITSFLSYDIRSYTRSGVYSAKDIGATKLMESVFFAMRFLLKRELRQCFGILHVRSLLRCYSRASGAG